MVVIDIDGLKKVNDAHGHDAGDLLLKRVGESCLKVLRQGDILARFGGDEFAAFIGDTSEDEGKRAAARLKEAISAVEVAGVVASASVGVAFGSPAADYEHVLRLADAAMYEEKRDVHNGVRGLATVGPPPGSDGPGRRHERPITVH
jgi:diguanylate cyclase